MTLVKVGVYCLRGGGHWACYDEDDAAMCGTKGPDVFIDVDEEDFAYYPEWLQRAIDWHREDVARGLLQPAERDMDSRYTQNADSAQTPHE